MNQRPISLNGLTSAKPTVPTVITVMYKAVSQAPSLNEDIAQRSEHEDEPEHEGRKCDASASQRESLLTQLGDVRQVPVQPTVVKPVPHHEPVRYVDTPIRDGKIDDPPDVFVQQSTDLETSRVAIAQIAQDVVQRKTRVDDVLDDDHVRAIDRIVKVLSDAHSTRRTSHV